MLLPRLVTSYVPECDRRVVEPFFGTAVVAANHPYRRLWVNDTNAAFVNLLNWIIREPDALLDAARDVWGIFGPAGEQGYYAARELYNRSHAAGASTNADSAALTLFLNKHGYNGLFRLNKSGGFNVPYGRRRVGIPEAEVLAYHWAFARREAQVTSLDFREVMASCGTGDVIFCDPPYVPASKTSSFTAYGNRWQESDHAALAELAEAAADLGAAVLVSASDTEASRTYYANARMLLEIRVPRRVAAAAEARKTVGELIFVY